MVNIYHLFTSTGATTGNVSMSLENMLGHADATALASTYSDATEKVTLALSAIGQRKFTVPFQWGFDGDNPANPILTGNDISATNTMGFDLSSATASGSIAYKRAINAVSNPDEFDINLLVTPGVIHRLHPTVTNHAILKVEARADAFYVMDAAAYGDTIATSPIFSVGSADCAEGCTDGSVDVATNRFKFVPPSVVIPGVYAFNDKVAHPWFAPAGLNRGSLTTVVDVYTRLTHAERDTLYEVELIQIAIFPGQGVCVLVKKHYKLNHLHLIESMFVDCSLRKKFIASLQDT